MRLVTWNIQWGMGIDRRVDLERIVRTARAMANFDVLCVQEVADNFPAPGLEANDDRDQFAELARLLPGHTRVEGYGVDLAGEDGRRRRFGNAIFTRYGVLSIRRHPMPWPADPGVETMPRVAVEATLECPMGALRVTTTHLEYYSNVQRQAQAARLRELHEEACDRAARPARARHFRELRDAGFGPPARAPRARRPLAFLRRADLPERGQKREIVGDL
jgi:endonuclease/exonuclease/phosphatase family metal-dependent hydrolase